MLKHSQPYETWENESQKAKHFYVVIFQYRPHAEILIGMDLKMTFYLI